jgi:hypothetical protein
MTERNLIERSHDLDADKLFGGTIEDMIAYLRDQHACHVPQGITATVEQNWGGYEENRFSLQWQALETDEEFEARKRRAEWHLKRNLEIAEKEQARLEQRRQGLLEQQRELDEQINKLNTKRTPS